MDVLIVYEGGHGPTRRAARLMGAEVAAAGGSARVKGTAEADPAEVAEADAVLTGCWVQGRIPFGGRPTRLMGEWISSIPSLDGTPAGAFCTYRFFGLTYADAVARTAESLAAMQAGLEARGADVVATRTIHRRGAGSAAQDLIRQVMESAAA